MTADDGQLRTRRRAIVAAIALVCAQAIAVAAYLQIERSRAANEQRAFRVERLSQRAAGPDLVVQAADGSERRLRRARGKTVLLHFWATWCPPCKAELPQLLDLAGRLERAGDFELVAVAVKDDWRAISAILGARPPAAVYLDASGEAGRAFEVSVLPDSYVLDAAGAPIARIAGARDWSRPGAREALERLIAR